MGRGLNKRVSPQTQLPRVWAADKSVWPLGPLILAKWLRPMKTTLKELIELEKLWFMGHVSRTTYDSWMGLNTEVYQLGSNAQLLQLWEARVAEVTVIPNSVVAQNVRRGHVIARRSKRSAEGEVLDPNKPFTLPTCAGLWYRRCRVHGVDHVQIVRTYPHVRDTLKPLNALFPWLELDDKNKTNLDLTSLVYRACKAGMTESVNAALALIPIGATNTIATTMVIFALGNKMWLRMRELMRQDKACCMDRTGFAKYFKAVSVAIRRTSRWVDGEVLGVDDVAAAAYVELGTGRAAWITDWSEERRKRVGPRLPLISPIGGDFLDDLRQECHSILTTLMPMKDKWGSWRDFTRSRQRWAPSGSSGGHRVTVEGERVRANKHTYYETITAEEMDSWLKHEPKIEALGSEKMEAGKARAIYGSKPIEQAIAHYVVTPIENRFTSHPHLPSGTSGLREVVGIGKRLKVVSQDRIECSMLDYADFNYQHTLSAMHVLFDTVLQCITKLVPDNVDAIEAARWLRDAQINQWVRFPNEDEWVQVTQGMFSGVRTTNFTNTLLNLAYYNVAKAYVMKMHGLGPIDEYHLHQGDDVWVSNRSRLWAATLYQTMTDMGLVFQPSKQMFDMNRGEFLRVLYTNQGARGYLMRGVATLIIKPIQSVDELAPQARGTSLNSQINLLYRRGLTKEACDILWWATIPHALRLKLPDGGGVGIPVWAASLPYTKGGLDLGPPNTIHIGGVEIPSLPAPVLHTAALELAVARNMSHDWVVEISKKVRKPFDAERVEKALHATNVSDSLRPVDRLQTMRLLEREMKLWREKVKKIPSKKYGNRGLKENVASTTHLGGVLMQRKMEWAEMFVRGEGLPKTNVSIVDALVKGIGATPFRDLSSAKLGLHLNTIQAARAALALAPDSMAARAAGGWLTSLETMLGAEVTAAILEGTRGSGPSYESWLHPIVLSWVTKTATNWAIFDAIDRGTRTRHEWDIVLDEWVTTVCEYAIATTGLVDWSHY